MTESIIKVIATTSIISVICLIGFIIAIFKFKDIKLAFGKTNIDMSKGVRDVQYKYIAMCMIYAESKVEGMIGFMKDIYRLELMKVNDHAVQSQEYINFDNLLERIKHYVLDEVKKSIKDGIYNNIDNVIQGIEGILDVYYTGRFVSRKEIGDILSEKCYEDVYEKLKMIFVYAKDLIEK
jgi:hypothetical protein